MKVRNVVIRPPVTVRVDETLSAAARRMAEEGVGSLVVVDHQRPVGMVTDRDLVVRAMAKDVPGDGRVDSVMSMGLVAIDADADVRDAVAIFASHAVRRLPVVSHDRVVGVVTVDDLVVALTADVADRSQELAEVTRGLVAQIMFPHAGREPAKPAGVPHPV